MLLLFAAAATAVTTVPDKSRPLAQSPVHCANATSHNAGQAPAPLKPRKLTELPPASGYMAVYRLINGCSVPMTVTEYRGGNRR